MGLFEFFLKPEWPELRRLGRTRFVWHDRVLLFGLPSGMFMASTQWIERGYNIRTALFTPRGLLTGAEAIALFLIAFYVSGRFEWDRREKQFLSGE